MPERLAPWPEASQPTARSAWRLGSRRSEFSGTVAFYEVNDNPSPDWDDEPHCDRRKLTGMVERLEGMPPGTIGFRARGEIEREDYDKVLVPELRRTLERGGGLRTLYVIEDVDEVEPGALWADAKLGVNLGLRHHEAWVRSAIVTDSEWMARATKLFAWMIPGEARVFALAELDQAKAWVAGT